MADTVKSYAALNIAWPAPKPSSCSICLHGYFIAAEDADREKELCAFW